MRMNQSTKKALKYTGISLFSIGLILFLVTFLNLGAQLSVASTTQTGQLSFRMSSTNPDSGLLLASVEPALVKGYTYKFAVTIANTGSLPFYGHATIRILSPNSTYQVVAGNSAYLGADGGQGAIQVCNGNLNSTQCLEPLNQWQISAYGDGVSINPGEYVSSIVYPNVINPGQTVTVYFTIQPPSNIPNGNYKMLFNFVADSSGVSQVVGYQVLNIDVGSFAGEFSVEELGFIALSIAGLLAIAFAFM